MGFLQEFLIALAVLYAVECVLAIRRDLTVFWSLGLGPSRVTHAEALPGSPTRGLFLAMPLPPLGTVFLSQFWPLSISPAGITNCRPHTVSLDLTQEPAVEFLAFDAIEKLAQDGDYVCLNGRRFARALDSSTAANLLAIIRLVNKAPAGSRRQVIETAMAESLDPDAVRSEVSRIHRQARPLRLVGNAMLVHLFLVCPLIAWRLGLSGTWFYLLGAILVLWGSTIVFYYTAHRALCPAMSADRRQHAIILALTPLAAIRATDALFKQRLTRFQPLAIAAALCGRSAFREFARITLSDLEWPRTVDRSTEHKDAAAAVEWFRARLRAQCAALAAAAEIDVAELLSPPTPEDRNCKAYCPRCLGQFVKVEPECPYCAGVPLHVFCGGLTAVEGAKA
jgi:hypothetical protein